ncbi:MAG: type 1 glutamine amidotransferase, partial [Verrucomicrobiales bacterium]
DYVVVWTCPQGKSQVMGLSTGHDVSDWNAEPFQHLVIDGVNFLAGKK